MKSIAMIKKYCLLLLMALVAMSAWGCEPPPKPKDLVDFEAFRQSKDNAELLKIDEVKELMEHSEQFFVIAMEAYDDEELERVKEYSVLGMMKWRTAKAVLDRNRAKDRMTEANAKYVRLQGVRNDNNNRREQIEKTVAVLEEQIRLKDTLARKDLERDTEREKEKRAAAIKEKELGAQQALGAAREKRKEAEGIKAEDFAAGTYNKANNALKAAERFMVNKDFDRAAQDAAEATRYFEKAIEESKPSFAAEQEKLAKDESNKKLFEKAHSTFRDLVKIDGRGMVVTIDALFKPRKSSVDPSRAHLLDIVDKLAKEFPTYDLLIAGHTDKFGNANRNKTLSQTRAQTVRDFFLQRGIPASRMQTAWYGGTQPAFQNRGKERFRNNRVEIIFLYK
jgi:outer membrane protein OmpA-like peptidoglycan-associated protein